MILEKEEIPFDPRRKKSVLTDMRTYCVSHWRSFYSLLISPERAELQLCCEQDLDELERYSCDLRMIRHCKWVVMSLQYFDQLPREKRSKEMLQSLECWRMIDQQNLEVHQPIGRQ